VIRVRPVGEAQPGSHLDRTYRFYARISLAPRRDHDRAVIADLVRAARRPAPAE
jgi:hypothetical protein